MIPMLHSSTSSRDLCSHNLRFRMPGISNICLICHCNKINDLLSIESGGCRKLSSSNILDILHQFRVLISALDVPFEYNLFETLLSPVLQTSLVALQLHHAEVGKMVSQALEKIRSKLPESMLEAFIDKLSAQILQKASFGNLLSLSVLIRDSTCCSILVKNYAPRLLPCLVKLFVDQSCVVIWKHSVSHTSDDKSLVKYHSVPIEDDLLFEVKRNESLRLLDTLVELFGSMTSHDKDVPSTREGKSQSLVRYDERVEVFQIFYNYIKDILETCMKVLTYTMTLDDSYINFFNVKILNFLESLYRYSSILRATFTTGQGTTFCSMIKKMLFCQSNDVKVATLALFHRMLISYKNTTQEAVPDAMSTDFPAVVSQVELVYFVTESMNTSCEILLRASLQVLIEINNIPSFRQGQMIPVLEAVLRVARMQIPDSITDPATYSHLNSFLIETLATSDSVPLTIYGQLMYLFEKLPHQWTTEQYLPWIKLLVFCGRNIDLQNSLMKIFSSFHLRCRNVGNVFTVAPLKCVLLIASALMECNPTPGGNTARNLVGDTFSSTDNSLLMTLLGSVMEFDLLPPIMLLAKHATSEDAIYAIILLKIIENLPESLLLLDASHFTESPELSKLKVSFDSPLDDDETSKAPYDIEIDTKNAVLKTDEGKSYWSSRTLVNILGILRLNADLMIIRELFELWNRQMARIISLCSTHHLQQLTSKLNAIKFEGENTVQEKVRTVLQTLDINAKSWYNIFESQVGDGRNVISSEKHDVVLAFYYTYTFFNGVAVMKFLDENLLQQLSNNIAMLLCAKERDLMATSFYLKVCLALASVMQPDLKATILISNLIRRSLLETIDQESFKRDVMTYHPKVFAFVLREKYFPDPEQLLEIWITKDKASSGSFLESGFFDGQLNLEINNCVLALASLGNEETSMLAVRYGALRVMKFKTGFEFSFFVANVHQIIVQIFADNCSELDTNSINLLRLSNVIQLAVKDELLLSSANNVPTDLIQNVVKIMLKHYDLYLLGKTCLEFLSKLLRTDSSKAVMSHLTSNGEFISFLGNKLCTVVGHEDTQESMCLHQLFTIILMGNTETPPGSSFNWKLSSILSYIHDRPRVEILEFLSTIFKTNFSSKILRVAETDSAEMFSKSLLNLLFHMQVLAQKVILPAAREEVWTILCEYLRIAEEGHPILKTEDFQNNVIFQPWIKVLITHTLATCKHIPSKLSIKQLQFLDRWCKLMVNNKLSYSHLRTAISQQFVFAPYLELFKSINRVMKKGPTQTEVKPEVKVCSSSEASCRYSELSFSIDKKPLLITRIAKTTDTFLSLL